MSEFSQSDVLWCLHTFSMLSLDGVWAMPRSGLVFRKTSLSPPTLELIETMPHMPGMPLDSTSLREFQREDLEVTRRAFREAGITIEGEIE